MSKASICTTKKGLRHINYYAIKSLIVSPTWQTSELQYYLVVGNQSSLTMGLKFHCCSIFNILYSDLRRTYVLQFGSSAVVSNCIVYSAYLPETGSSIEEGLRI